MEKEKKVRDLLSWLSVQGIGYEFIEHAKGKTTAEASNALGVEKSAILKCLLFESQLKDFVGIIITGDRRVSPEKLRETTGKNFKLAPTEDVQVQTGYDVGGIPPFAFLIRGITCYVDVAVMKLQWVYGSAGSATSGIKFSPLSFEKVEYKIADIGEEIHDE